MAERDVVDWVDEQMVNGLVYAKRLPYYDIVGHFDGVGGIFVPRQVIFRVVPSLSWSDRPNPSAPLDLTIDSHPYTQMIEAVWYNRRLRGRARNETRLRGFAAASVLGDTETTGSLAVFAFRGGDGMPFAPPACRLWVCDTAAEEDCVEERIGPADPGTGGTLWPYLFDRLDRPKD